GAAALLKESMDYGRPLTPEQVEEERKNLMELVTKLDKEGKIAIRKKKKMGILEGEEAADDSEPLSFAPVKGGAAKQPAEAVDPVKAEECFQLGTAAYEQGRYTEAVQNFHYAVQAQPDLWQAYQYLGASYFAQGMVNEAAGAYERMCELNEDPSLKAWVEQWK